MGFVLTKLYDPRQSRVSSWTIRSGMAALAVPALRAGPRGWRPRPFLVSLIDWARGSGVSLLEVLTGAVAAFVVVTAVWAYGYQTGRIGRVTEESPPGKDPA